MTVTHDLSIISLISQASILVQLVMALLASMVCVGSQPAFAAQAPKRYKNCTELAAALAAGRSNFRQISNCTSCPKSIICKPLSLS